MRAEDFVEPDDVVFAILIQGVGKASVPPDWTTAAQILSRMRDRFDVPMTTTVYNALLELCVKSNDVSRAEDLLVRMRGDELQPDEHTQRIMESKRAFRTALRRAFQAPQA
jgi:pentatricopeptide repeat protein